MDLESLREIYKSRLVSQPVDCSQGSRFAFVHSDQKFKVFVFVPFLNKP